MKKPVAYGIDFGMTNSSISVAYSNGTIGLVDIGAISAMPHSLPSITYLHRDGVRMAGRAAIEQFLITGSHSTICKKCSLINITKWGVFTDCRQCPLRDDESVPAPAIRGRQTGWLAGSGCQDSRLMSGLKSFLTSKIPITHSWAKDFDWEELISVILKVLKNRADQLTGREVDKAVIGCPIVFPGAEGDDHEKLQDRALTRLEGAAERAGFSDIEIFSEPAAVLLDQYLDEGFSMAVDFGGGTYDVAILEIEKGEAEVVASQGAAVGGEKFDALIFDNIAAEGVGLNQISNGKGLPKFISSKMRTLTGIAELLRTKTLLPALHGFADGGADISIIDEILHGGQAYSFYKEIENAKIDLSDNQITRIDFSRPDSGISISQEIHRKDFERWIRPYLDKVDEATRAALDEAGIKPGQVHTVLRTGGSSMIPQFINRLEKIFPEAEIRKRPAFTSVACGLGSRALEVWCND